MRAHGTILCGFLISLAGVGQAQGTGTAGMTPYEGFYTDKPSYEPDEAIVLHGNWKPAGPGSPTAPQITYGLWEMTASGWSYCNASQTQTYPLQPLQPAHGSFVTFEGAAAPQLGGREQFTLEGWIRPTLVPSGSTVNPRDRIVLAGQLTIEDISGGGAQLAGLAGIGLTEGGKPFAFVQPQGGGQALEVVAGNALPSDCRHDNADWVHVAMVFSQIQNETLLELYVGGLPAALPATMPGSINVATDPSLDFRFGAASNALTVPSAAAFDNDRRGHFDGVLDDWRLWNEALSPSEVELLPLGTLPAGKTLGLECDFDDLYGTGVANKVDPSAADDGIIVNHGTSVAGRSLTPTSQGIGRGLRLNHDQCVDAQWNGNTVNLTIPSTCSGLHMVWAERGASVSTAPPDPCDPTLGEGNIPFMQCIVVRPKNGQPATSGGVAVLYPVLTWQAYNGWPGDPFGGALRPAEQISLRSVQRAKPGKVNCMTVECLAAQPVSQGNNSAYTTMGDGLTRPFYQGWRRPSRPANPYGGSYMTTVAQACALSSFADCGFSVLAPAAAQMAKNIHSILPSSSTNVDSYSDWDLEDASFSFLDVSKYKVLVLTAHHEYWTPRMLDRLNAFVDNGGSVLSVAGNVFAFRIDLQDGVTEVRKWPAIRMLGDVDALSHIAESRGEPSPDTGAFGLVEQVNQRNRTSVLGTRVSLVQPVCDAPQGFGSWAATEMEDWPWFATPPQGPFGDFDTGQGMAGSAGHELDEALTDLTKIPFVNPEQHHVLAYGCNFGPGARKINWDLLIHRTPALTGTPVNISALEKQDLDDWSQCGSWPPPNRRVQVLPANCPASSCDPAPADSTGNIVYFETPGGGAILSVAASAAPWGMVDPAMQQLLSTTLDKMLNGEPTVCQEDLGPATGVQLTVCGEGLDEGETSRLMVTGATANSPAVLELVEGSNTPVYLTLPESTDCNGTLTWNVPGYTPPVTYDLRVHVFDLGSGTFAESNQVRARFGL